MSQAWGNASDHSFILSLIVAKRRFVEMLLVSLLAFSLRLNQCIESFTAFGNVGDAKMAFASGYIALTLSTAVAESEQIENKMATLLDSLNARRPTK